MAIRVDPSARPKVNQNSQTEAVIPDAPVVRRDTRPVQKKAPSLSRDDVSEARMSPLREASRRVSEPTPQIESVAPDLMNAFNRARDAYLMAKPSVATFDPGPQSRLKDPVDVSAGLPPRFTEKRSMPELIDRILGRRAVEADSDLFYSQMARDSELTNGESSYLEGLGGELGPEAMYEAAREMREQQERNFRQSAIEEAILRTLSSRESRNKAEQDKLFEERQGPMWPREIKPIRSVLDLYLKELDSGYANDPNHDSDIPF